MPKSTQTTLTLQEIRDNHNHYTSVYACFSYYTMIIDLLMSTYSRHAILGVFLTFMWEKFMFSLSVIFILLLIHATQKASVGMYNSGCDYLLSLVCVLFGIAVPTSSFNLFNCFYTCFCSFLLYEPLTISPVAA